MKISELKVILSGVNDDYDIYVRDVNGCLVTDNLKIKTLICKPNKSYIIED